MPETITNAEGTPSIPKVWTKVRKSGPFDLPKITDQYPLYSQQIAEEIRKIGDLPDFGEDKRVFVMSDYGGEHETAPFNTYAFLIASVDKLGVFKQKMHDLREGHGLNAPFVEFAYKKLGENGYTPIKRALPDYLCISGSFIHGVLVTISVEKSVSSLFGPERRTAQQAIVNLLSANNLGDWGPKEAEKLLRICHPIAIFLALLTHSGQKFLWMTDNDAITQDCSARTYENTQQAFMHALRMYTDNEYEICGFAKAFNKEPFTNDLLSLSDFAAGAIQDVLQSLKLNNVSDNLSKREIIRWLGTPSGFLSKVNLVFKMDGNRMICGNVSLKAKSQVASSTP